METTGNKITRAAGPGLHKISMPTRERARLFSARTGPAHRAARWNFAPLLE